MHVTITDAEGAVSSYTGNYCAENGELELNLLPAMNDVVGRWNIVTKDLTTGMTAEHSFELR